MVLDYERAFCLIFLPTRLHHSAKLPSRDNSITLLQVVAAAAASNVALNLIPEQLVSEPISERGPQTERRGKNTPSAAAAARKKSGGGGRLERSRPGHYPRGPEPISSSAVTSWGGEISL